MLVYNDADSRILEIRYELIDGTVFEPGQEEWEAECEWFKENLPEVEPEDKKEDE